MGNVYVLKVFQVPEIKAQNQSKEHLLLWLAELMGAEKLDLETKVLLAGASQFHTSDGRVELQPDDTEQLARELQIPTPQLLDSIRAATGTGWISPLEHSGHLIRFRIKIPQA